MNASWCTTAHSVSNPRRALTLQALTTNFRSCRQHDRFGIRSIGVQCNHGKSAVDSLKRSNYWTYRHVRNLIFKRVMTKTKLILTHCSDPRAQSTVVRILAATSVQESARLLPSLPPLLLGPQRLIALIPLFQRTKSVPDQRQ